MCVYVLIQSDFFRDYTFFFIVCCWIVLTSCLVISFFPPLNHKFMSLSCIFFLWPVLFYFFYHSGRSAGQRRAISSVSFSFVFIQRLNCSICNRRCSDPVFLLCSHDLMVASLKSSISDFHHRIRVSIHPGLKVIPQTNCIHLLQNILLVDSTGCNILQ